MAAASGCVLLRSATMSAQSTGVFGLKESVVVDVVFVRTGLQGNGLVYRILKDDACLSEINPSSQQL